MVGYSGDGSYQKLIRNVYGMNKSSISLTQKYQENDNKIRLDEFNTQLAFSFIKSANYEFSKGSFGGLRSYGYYWEKYSSLSVAYIMSFFNTSLDPLSTNNRGHGFSLRCVAKSLN